MTTHTQPSHSRIYTTAVLSRKRGVKSETVRHSLYMHGHYMNLVPLKVGRSLTWDADQADKTFAGVPFVKGDSK